MEQWYIASIVLHLGASVALLLVTVVVMLSGSVNKRKHIKALEIYRDRLKALNDHYVGAIIGAAARDDDDTSGVPK